MRARCGWQGGRSRGVAPRAICRLGVGRTFQITATFASMTVRENVQVALMAHRRMTRRWWRPAAGLEAAAADALLDQVGLAAQADRATGVLAYGDLKRLELAIALAAAPRLLLMDEPTAGMAPRERVALMQLVRRIASDRGLAVLFTEHDMDVVFGVAGPHRGAGTGRTDRGRRWRHDPGGCAGAGDLSRRRRHQRGTLMLAVSGLNSFYGQAHILHDVSFGVGAGSVMVLLGRNGAGKSTVMKSLIGLVRPASGSVRFAGQEVARLEPFRRAQLGLGYVPEERRIFSELTVMENLDVGRQGAARGTPGLDAGAAVRAVPQSGRDAAAAGRADERRRAADAVHRAHADGEPAPAAAGRAERGAVPADRGADGGGDFGAAGGGAEHFAGGAEPAFRGAGGG